MTNSLPWYREPWPWIVMSGPAIVVVAGIVTAGIAFSTSDGLVADDYYKQGLAVNRVLARETRAEALAVTATVQFNPARDRVQVIVASKEASPDSVTLTLVHPTRGDDRSVEMERISRGVYRGAMRAPAPVNYHMRLEDGPGTWRLTGRWRPGDDVVTLGLPY